MKQLYFSVLIAGVLGVLVGIFLIVALAARGQLSGDGMYRTTWSERKRIRRGDDPKGIRGPEAPDGPAAAEPVNHKNAGRDVPTKRPVGFALLRPKVETVSGNGTTSRISRPSETIDVSVSGSDHTITIAAGTRVNTLSISGTSNSVVFERPVAHLERVLAGGTENVLIVPEGLKFEMLGAGATTQIAKSGPAID